MLYNKAKSFDKADIDMKIMIMSDVVPTASSKNEYTDGAIEKLLSNGFREKLNEAAFNIVNLECPLTRENEPAAKWGSRLKALPESIEALRKIPGLVVNLANNHIRDYGSQGVLDTIQVLEEYDIPYLGAGRELEHSNRSLILESSSYKIGVYSCTEHEFSIAGEKSAGAHPVEEGEDILALQKLKRQTDYVIFLYHGGVEFYPYPTPEMQKRLRRYVSAGADLVVCQHSHCIGCTETYQNGILVYGQGNFLFGERPEVEANIQDQDAWKSGMALCVDIKEHSIEYLFYRNKNGILDWTHEPEMLGKMQERNKLLQTPGFLREEWGRYCARHANYMEIFQKSFFKRKAPWKSRIKKSIAALTGKDTLSEQEYLRIYNYLTCEVHQELLRTNCKAEIEKRNTGCFD